jgi:hypothetical protein
MNTQMQFTTFTHGKCTKCGYLALTDRFEHRQEVLGESEDGSIGMYRLVLVCPICSDEFCEGVFPNEVN